LVVVGDDGRVVRDAQTGHEDLEAGGWDQDVVAPDLGRPQPSEVEVDCSRQVRHRVGVHLTHVDRSEPGAGIVQLPFEPCRRHQDAG
jgi:hypothetical protein